MAGRMDTKLSQQEHLLATIKSQQNLNAGKVPAAATAQGKQTGAVTQVAAVAASSSSSSSAPAGDVAIEMQPVRRDGRDEYGWFDGPAPKIEGKINWFVLQ